jgi:Domain of unknown function (DUF892)
VDAKKDPILTTIAAPGKNISKENGLRRIRDAGLIATPQKIEHYEIASYVSARDWAAQLGLTHHVATLQANAGKARGPAFLADLSSRQQGRFHSTLLIRNQLVRPVLQRNRPEELNAVTL